MNSTRRKGAGGKFALILVVLLVSTIALAQDNKKNPPPSHGAAPPAGAKAPPAQAPRPSAPNAQRPGGPGAPSAGRPNTGPNTGRGPNANAGRPGAPNGANANRGPNNNSRGTGPGANNARGPNNGRGPNAGGANAGRGPNNTRGPATANRRGPPTITREIKTRSGASVQASYRGGHVRSIQSHNMRIDRGLHGERRIVTERNGRRIVSMGRGRGYMERPYFNRGGRAYIQRTYYVNGRPYAYAYRGYYYGGVRYYGYAPAYYYQPVYYGWAYNPWPQPVYYRWGYYNDPWYGYYNYYYQPYPAYPTASSWLTDYMISEQLRAAYEARLAGKAMPDRAPFGPSQDVIAALWSSDSLIADSLESVYGLAGLAAFAGDAPAKLSPELKQALADEVKQQIADDKSASESSQQTTTSGGDEVPPALSPKFRTFMVSSSLDVTTDDGQDCSLSSGDVIQRTSDSLGEDNKISVTVKSSKKDDCAVGANTAVDSNDLQEMHNHFRETLDAGLKSLAEKSGKDGLPAAPDTSTKTGEVPAPQPDAGVDNELNQQQKDADQTEAEVPQQDSGSQ